MYVSLCLCVSVFKCLSVCLSVWLSESSVAQRCYVVSERFISFSVRQNNTDSVEYRWRHRGFHTEHWAPPLSSQTLDLTAVWYCVDEWTAWWFESDSNTHMKVICFNWLQLIAFLTKERVPWLMLIYRNQPAFCSVAIALACFANMAATLHLTRWVPVVTFWLAGAAGYLAVRNPLFQSDQSSCVALKFDLPVWGCLKWYTPNRRRLFIFQQYYQQWIIFQHLLPFQRFTLGL